MDETIISGYFTIPRLIKKMKQHAINAEHKFWQRSFMASPMAIDEIGNRAGSRPFDMLVDDLVVFQQFVEEYIQLLAYEHRRFIDYINKLDTDALDVLKRKYVFNQDVHVDETLETTLYAKCVQITADAKTKFYNIGSVQEDINVNYSEQIETIIERMI